MRNLSGHIVGHYLDRGSWMGAPPAPSRTGLLHLVTAQEVADLRAALVKPELPPDFEDKLRRLARGTLPDRSIEQHCRLFVALLKAADVSFREASPLQREQLVRVLAYVRKTEDAIPDYRPGGFTDDYAAVRAVKMELLALLESYKLWRLRHQVPGMWHSGGNHFRQVPSALTDDGIPHKGFPSSSVSRYKPGDGN